MAEMTMGFATIPESPFVLVAMLKHHTVFVHWLYQRSNVIWFLLTCIIGILIIAAIRVRHIVSHLRESDTRRAKVLHNIKYTNKMATLGRLASGVTHEINNPMAIINEKAGLIKDILSHGDDHAHKDRIIELSNSIASAVERCSRVTHRLLGFGRRMDMHKEQIDLKLLINDVHGISALGGLAPKHPDSRRRPTRCPDNSQRSRSVATGVSQPDK